MFDIFPPPKTKILIFDFHGSEYLSKCLPRNSSSVLFTRYEKLNLFIILKCFLKFKFKYRDYLKIYIEYVKPKILLTYIDNNIFFYQINFNFLKKIAIQNSRRTGIPLDMFFNIKRNSSKLKSDYLLLHNEGIANEN